MNNEFNLEDKINLLHNFVYDNKNTNITDLIIDKNIPIENIKFSHKNINLVDKIYSEAFKGNFRFVNYIPGTNTMIINRLGNYPLTFFISPYKKEKDARKKSNSMNNDSGISYLLSPLVINKLVPNLLLPIVNMDLRFSQISNILVPLTSYKNFSKKIKKGKYSNLISVRIRENFYKKQNLTNYLGNSNLKKKITLKPILFQILYTLDKINEIYPNFRHNSLEPDHIYLYKSRKSTKYNINNKSYLIKHNNNLVKIGHFEKSVYLVILNLKKQKKYHYMEKIIIILIFIIY